MYELLPSLEILDGFDKDNNEVISQDDEEEGEDEMVEGLFGEGEEEEIDEETYKKLVAEGKIVPEDDEQDEEKGETNGDDCDKSKFEPAGKRQKTDE